MSPGQRVREARQLLEPKLSTKELDYLAHFPAGYVWSMEKSGGSKAANTTLDAIARVLGLSLDYLIRGEGDPPTKESVAAAVTVAREAREAEPASERTPKPGKEPAA